MDVAVIPPEKRMPGIINRNKNLDIDVLMVFVSFYETTILRIYTFFQL